MFIFRIFFHKRFTSGENLMLIFNEVVVGVISASVARRIWPYANFIIIIAIIIFKWQCDVDILLI